jgi:hypothetical protein
MSDFNLLESFLDGAIVKTPYGTGIIEDISMEDPGNTIITWCIVNVYGKGTFRFNQKTLFF